MKAVINDKYSSYREQILSIPCFDGTPVDVIRDSRNKILRLNIGGLDCVMKRFRVPVALNRFVYSFIRKSKPRRAYENAVKLGELGIETNYPIAYIETYKNRLFDYGYYIYEWLPYPVLDNLSEHPEAERKEILDELARFANDMHRKGVFFLDFNCGNIMYYKKDGKWHFALLDINRMSFKNRPLSKSKTVVVFKHCTLPPCSLAYLLEQYAYLNNWEERILIGRVFLKKGVNIPVRTRKFFKRLFKRS